MLLTQRDDENDREVTSSANAIDLAIQRLAEKLIKTIRQPHPDRESWQRMVGDAAQMAFMSVDDTGIYVEAVKKPSFADGVVSELIEIREHVALVRQRLEKERKELLKFASFMRSSRRKKN
jgi:hypothetical protein